MHISQHNLNNSCYNLGDRGADFPANINVTIERYCTMIKVSVWKAHRNAAMRAFSTRRLQARDAGVARMWKSDVSQRGAGMTTFVIGIAVAALVVAIIVPIAFSQFFSTDTGSWDAQTILIWGIIPVVIILAIVLFFLNKADDQA